jgi:hypothetical protein
MTNFFLLLAVPLGLVCGFGLAAWSEAGPAPAYEYRQINFKGGDVASGLNAAQGWEVSAYLAQNNVVYGALLRRRVRP